MSSSAQPDKEVPRPKGSPRPVDYDKRLKEVLAEVKAADRAGEPQSFDLSTILHPEMLAEMKLLGQKAPPKSKKSMQEVVYPFPSIILTSAPRGDGNGEQDFEKGDFKSTTIFWEDDPGHFNTLAITAADPAKGITRGDIEREIQAFKGGRMCDQFAGYGDEHNDLLRAERDLCGRYRLVYGDRPE
ncbi:unnamed protein product [Vitrella brassicaformis CCMP3155]|uniref:Uncharacterized protein n=1 Tax=Vitrella brassicaformis (strain CCMP3155) TaxID=1169540 RepID=A0A0G4FPM8_VITBC|nr:unnamed protein product [Vitrella brassicaformis CCMP3155]|eukprot:CEM16413.1 unnamed protein product [Vitrella brassicaformis CCMP3155]